MGYYTIVGSGIGFEGGRYSGDAFARAAKKAGSGLFERLNNPNRFKDGKNFKQYSDKKSIFFILKETSQGSNKKTKAYTVTQKALAKPKTITIAGKQITYKYMNVVTELTSEAEIAKAHRECKMK